MNKFLGKHLNYSLVVRCEICGRTLPSINHCTTNICQECCESGRCPLKKKCKAYPDILENLLEERRYNPSRRSD